MDLRIGLLLLIVLLAFGCQEENGINKMETLKCDLEGSWKADNGAWQINIDDNGKIVSAIIPLGKVLVKPNNTTVIEMLDSNISTFQGGDFNLKYNPDNKELRVNIKIKHFKIVYRNNIIEGFHDYTLMGTLSENCEEWTADLFEEFDYGPLLPQDPNTILSGQVTLRKID